MSAPSWKDRVSGEMSPEMIAEINAFEGQIDLKKQGKLDDKFFAETRLRRGAYGQRYDNGLRSDGIEQRTLTFPQPLRVGEAKGSEKSSSPGAPWRAAPTLFSLPSTPSSLRELLRITGTETWTARSLYTPMSTRGMRRLCVSP